MSVPAGLGTRSSYFAQLFALARSSLARLARPSSHPRRGEARRRLAGHAVLLTTIGSALVVALMVGLDVREIELMPPRGSAGLWPVRILTDFGRAAFVLWLLAGLLLAVALILPRVRSARRSRLLVLGTHLQFLFLAVLVPVLAGELIKWIVGRGRPFVGGEANAFNFAHFAGTEAYASFPSAHAITSVALAFAVSAVWRQARMPMILYALLIIVSRLVLLAHHPSDVVAGAAIGLAGAMLVRYWFAARHLGFVIGERGTITPQQASKPRVAKRVARAAFAP
ncbi:MAG TPA: phosphatase PAP2 family protein [Bradyrhizobium sp.]